MSVLAADKVHRYKTGSGPEHTRGVKADKAMHKKYPAGKQTSKQLAAERANLKLADMAYMSAKSLLRNFVHTKTTRITVVSSAQPSEKARNRTIRLDARRTTGYKGTVKPEALPEIKTTGYKRNYKNNTEPIRTSLAQALHPFSRHPLGSDLLTVNLNAMPARTRPSGIWKHFMPNISPVGYKRRTGWQKGRAHHMRARLYIRQPRHKRLKKWRWKYNKSTPR